MENPEIQNIPTGYIGEKANDRIQCLAMELEISREELVGRALGVGLTILETTTDIENARVWVWDGSLNGRR
ncbi:MAG: hypothetical protein QG629_877, partial [Patescibacteria group bacterium]|nr:hypothetical protein [Patescibacteria group bacterium]